MRILSISSHVAYGLVGNSAAVPAMQAKGHEVLAIPTIVLSNHPGHGPPAGFRTLGSDLAAILGKLDALGALRGVGAVMTGYFASAEQVRAVAEVLSRMKTAMPQLYILVDPVIGDGDQLYVPLPVAEAVRDELLPLATCITPNSFELQWLSGSPVGRIAEALVAAQHLGLAEVLATSIPAGPDRLATLAITANICVEHFSTLQRAVPHGTGDFLAGLYLTERLEHGPEQALHKAMAVLELAIARSAGSAVLDVAGALLAARQPSKQSTP